VILSKSNQAWILFPLLQGKAFSRGKSIPTSNASSRLWASSKSLEIKLRATPPATASSEANGTEFKVNTYMDIIHILVVLIWTFH
jgi:hypothetical protein